MSSKVIRVPEALAADVQALITLYRDGGNVQAAIARISERIAGDRQKSPA